MGQIGFALCKALRIKVNEELDGKQIIAALFENKYTGNPVKDRILAKINELGAKIIVDPRILSLKEMIMELVRTLKIRRLPADRRALTLICQGEATAPIDKLFYAIFGMY